MVLLAKLSCIFSMLTHIFEPQPARLCVPVLARLNRLFYPSNKVECHIKKGQLRVLFAIWSLMQIEAVVTSLNVVTDVITQCQVDLAHLNPEQQLL